MFKFILLIPIESSQIQYNSKHYISDGGKIHMIYNVTQENYNTYALSRSVYLSDLTRFSSSWEGFCKYTYGCTITSYIKHFGVFWKHSRTPQYTTSFGYQQ